MFAYRSLQIKSELEEIASHLMYPDENGYPLTVHLIPASDNPLYHIFTISGAEGEFLISEFGTDDFFNKPFTRLSSFGDTEDLYKGFTFLKSSVECLLSDIRIFHIGEVKKDVFLLGTTSDDDYIIISTRMLTYPLHLIRDW